jgi:hypothetical protein
MNILLHYKEMEEVTRALSLHASRLMIKLHTGVHGEKGREAFVDKYVKLGADVFEGPLSPFDYNTVWSSLDGIILPYHTVKYQRQCSGMMFESLSDGIVPIVPDHTSMAAIARETGMGLIYDADDPAALEKTLRQFVDEWPSLKKMVAEFGRGWREANSPKRVFDVLHNAWTGQNTTTSTTVDQVADGQI